MILFRVIEECPFSTEVQHADFSTREKAQAFIASFSEIIQSGMTIQEIDAEPGDDLDAHA